MLSPLVLFSCSGSQITNAEETENASVQVDQAEVSISKTDDLAKWRKNISTTFKL